MCNMQRPTNAKDEILEFLKEMPMVKCSKVRIDTNIGSTEHILKVGFTTEMFSKFIESLNLVYDSGWGGQELYGVIWFTNGTWASREEYDGSEWWQYNQLPEIPDDLISQ